MQKITLKEYKQKILSAAGDEKMWNKILSGFRSKDPFYLPAYLKIYENADNPQSFNSFGGRGLLFLFGDGRNYIIYPFFKRSVSYLAQADSRLQDLYDIISPYGYGGPLAQVEDEDLYPELWKEFFYRFQNYCQENRIVAEFCRLNPIFQNHLPVSLYSQGSLEHLGQVVYLDLSWTEEELLSKMAKGHRRHIRRALENPDLVFCTDRQPKHLERFFEIYLETMQAKKTHPKYFFSRRFFEQAFSNLGEHLSFWRVYYKGEFIAGWFILRYGELAYTWLSGSLQKYSCLFPNNYLVYRSILQLKSEGLKYFVLGGGLAASNDSLFEFKAGFSPLRKDYYVYKKIYLPAEYQSLVKIQGNLERYSASFFPLYRAGEQITPASPAGQR